jgi:hypothetical protein
MKKFINECKKNIFDHHAKLQKRFIPRHSAELRAHLLECEKGINPLNKNKLYVYWNVKIKQFKYLLSQIKRYLKVETVHATQGPAPKREVLKRIELCENCPGLVEELEGKTDPGGIGFCSLCGCGASRRAALSVKLTLAGATCPLSKWQPVKGEEKKLKHTKDAIKGILYSIIDRIKI